MTKHNVENFSVFVYENSKTIDKILYKMFWINFVIFSLFFFLFAMPPATEDDFQQCKDVIHDTYNQLLANQPLVELKNKDLWLLIDETTITVRSRKIMKSIGTVTAHLENGELVFEESTEPFTRIVVSALFGVSLAGLVLGISAVIFYKYYEKGRKLHFSALRESYDRKEK